MHFYIIVIILFLYSKCSKLKKKRERERGLGASVWTTHLSPSEIPHYIGSHCLLDPKLFHSIFLGILAQLCAELRVLCRRS